MQFSDIIGQHDVKQRLIQSVKENRVSHAQLFLGNTGSGSLALGIAYAQFICCENKQEEDSCGTCKSCIKYNKFIHPDLHFSYPVALSKEVRTSTDVLPAWREAVLGNPYLTVNDWFDFLEAENKQPVIGAEESAEILRKLNLTTYESEYKVMIIWMAEKMNPAAANKLLKILEEPPDKTLFILVCENEDQLLRTIISRTQLVKIKKIDEQSLEQVLMAKHSLSADEAKNSSQMSDGDYGVAIKLLGENESAEWNLASFQNWMRACLKFDMQKINSLLSEFNDLGRERQKNYLGYCLHIVRECVMANYADKNLAHVTDKEMEFLKKFSPFINAGNCMQFTEELNKAYMHIERNANPKILFLDISFKFNELLNIKVPEVAK
jgi:DNA polymerase-3 subunit delta'